MSSILCILSFSRCAKVALSDMPKKKKNINVMFLALLGKKPVQLSDDPFCRRLVLFRMEATA